MAMIGIRAILIFFLFRGFFAGEGTAQTIPGKPTPEIALPSLKGDTLRLSGINSRLILVDFWASWCGPCRTANRYLVKLYEKYKSKGFEIFGVSVDENLQAWKKAVAKDKLAWSQVIDRGGREGGIAISWNIYQLPTSYLFDRQGKLIAFDPGKKELEKILGDVLH